MDVSCGGASPMQPSLPPPKPKSPPDLYGKRRELAKVQTLEREIGILQDELKYFDGLPSASRPCKEVTDFVMAKPDPLIVRTKKRRRRCLFWKWLCGISCFNISCPCCCWWCSPSLKMPNCCQDCNCSVCQSCCRCSLPKCRCCSGKCCNCFEICPSCCRCSMPNCHCCSSECCKCCEPCNCFESLKCLKTCKFFGCLQCFGTCKFFECLKCFGTCKCFECLKCFGTCKCFGSLKCCETCKSFETCKCNLNCSIPKCLSCSDCSCKGCSSRCCLRRPKVKFRCSCTKNCCYPCFCFF
ncbi:hypothetical protein Leryth_007340 [Lithospermum erythrorhizon]|uniref:Guanine nucleotide-binding protein subunit gamma 3-like n=1 Tax=Lithospermum erythrorhizon TaxID=34254 RepID=A0AAV3S0I2_LITER|nr:hypothetical protein Leryth_007340 [Lithospermum erythrorhizon]